MDRPQNQHLIPKVYLKYFRTQAFPKEDKVWVFDFENIYDKKPKSKNVNAELFKEYEYYNSDDFTEDGYGLEMSLGKIENEYHLIMTDIINGLDLSKSVREKFLAFLISAKLRSPVWRSETYKNWLNFLSAITMGKFADSISDEELKEDHLLRITNPQLFNEMKFTLLSKKWFIYRITNDNSFITSDNPGFSIDWDNKIRIPNPYWENLKHDSVIFFPLSSKLCLIIGPYSEGTDLSINASNIPIEYLNADGNLIKSINLKTFLTKNKLVISNSTVFFDSLDLES